MSEQRFSPWFPGTVAPARPGVYQRDYPARIFDLYCRWDGQQWFDAKLSIEAAARSSVSSAYQCSGPAALPWRGLVKPEAQCPST